MLFEKGHGSHVKITRDFHPLTERKMGPTIQNSKDQFRACVIDVMVFWDCHLHFIEFSYDNRY